LLVVPIVLTIWVYYGKQANFGQLREVLPFGGRWNEDVYSTVYEYLAAFLLMFGVPCFIVTVVFRKRSRDFGFQLGDAKVGFRLIAIGVPVLLLAAYLGASNPAIQAEYPLARSMMENWGLFLIVEIFYLVYYVGWEFFFRGFMLFGLEVRYGALLAILAQTIPSTIVHIGKPASENFAAIIAGWVFGFVALRTRSILYSLILHATIGIATDVFVTLLQP
jgi:membrane protease YdiL (CAAX protease family)